MLSGLNVRAYRLGAETERIPVEGAKVYFVMISFPALCGALRVLQSGLKSASLLAPQSIGFWRGFAKPSRLEGSWPWVFIN